MMTSSEVFLDAYTLVYALDETNDRYDEDVTLCTSHHVIEEVLHVARKVSDVTATEVVEEIGKIPGLVLVEPDAMLAFAERYAKLSDKLRMGVNDALLLQLMLDAGITRLFSYDKQFVNRANSLGIERVA